MSIVRLPLAVDLTNREEAARGIFNTDTKLINCYIEREDNRMYVSKRPGLSQVFTYNGGAATNGQGTVYYKGALYVMGSNVLYRLNGTGFGSADGSAWSSSTAGPFQARAYAGCVAFNGQIFVMGGENTGGFQWLNDVWATSDGVNWTQITSAAPWLNRSRFGLAVLGNTLYLMGGQGNGKYFNDVWSTTDGVNWTQVIGNATWHARRNMGVVVFNQGIFLMGGNDSSGTYYNDVWFSPDGVTWTEQAVAATWSARMDFVCLSFGGFIWVMGGFNGGGLASCYKTTDGITWTNTGNIPANRNGVAAIVYTNKMFLVTGGTGGGGSTTTVYTTTDGASFTLVTASYGGNQVAGANIAIIDAASGGSNSTAPTLFLIAGIDVSIGYRNLIYRANLNVSLPSTFSPATSASTTTLWQTATQNLGKYLIWKNSSDAWVQYAGQFQKITSTNYPPATVPGIVNLDDTVYVMDGNGVIYGSNLSDPFTWSANNFITADFEADVGIAIAKYQQYVVALKSTTIQFFYDAGRYPGSPLLPALSGNQKVGCVAAGSVVNMDNTLVFMATTGMSDRYIGVLNGTSVQKISNPAIDRILFSWTPDALCYGQNIKTNGHDFYVLTLKSIGVTLVYDFVEQTWHSWQSANTAGNYFTGVNFVTDGTFGYLQDLTAGLAYRLDEVAYQDNSPGVVNINVSITMSKFDGGKNERKFCSSATVIGDRAGGVTGANTATLLWSDDDGATFNSGQTVDLTAECPTVNRLGSFYRRVHRITHSVNNPMRLEALELDVI